MQGIKNSGNTLHKLQHAQTGATSAASEAENLFPSKLNPLDELQDKQPSKAISADLESINLFQNGSSDPHYNDYFATDDNHQKNSWGYSPFKFEPYQNSDGEDIIVENHNWKNFFENKDSMRKESYPAQIKELPPIVTNQLSKNNKVDKIRYTEDFPESPIINSKKQGISQNANNIQCQSIVNTQIGLTLCESINLVDSTGSPLKQQAATGLEVKHGNKLFLNSDPFENGIPSELSWK